MDALKTLYANKRLRVIVRDGTIHSVHKRRVVRAFAAGARESDPEGMLITPVTSRSIYVARLFFGDGPRNWRSLRTEAAREAGRAYAASEEGRTEMARRKMGRPPAKPEAKRGAIVSVRLTPEERELIEKAATADRRSLSDYVRVAALRAAEGKP